MVECNNAASQHSTKIPGFTIGFCVAVDLTMLILQKTSTLNIDSLASYSNCQSISAVRRLVCQSACPNNYYLSSMPCRTIRRLRPAGVTTPTRRAHDKPASAVSLSTLYSANEAISHKANGMSRRTLLQRRSSAVDYGKPNAVGHRQLTTRVPEGSRGAGMGWNRRG